MLSASEYQELKDEIARLNSSIWNCKDVIQNAKRSIAAPYSHSDIFTREKYDRAVLQIKERMETSVGEMESLISSKNEILLKYEDDIVIKSKTYILDVICNSIMHFAQKRDSFEITEWNNLLIDLSCGMSKFNNSDYYYKIIDKLNCYIVDSSEDEVKYIIKQHKQD